MSGTNENKPRVRLPVKKDIALCILCGKSHERRPGPVHEINPLCKTCDDHMNNRPSEQVDTVDFQVKGF